MNSEGAGTRVLHRWWPWFGCSPSGCSTAALRGPAGGCPTSWHAGVDFARASPDLWQQSRRAVPCRAAGRKPRAFLRQLCPYITAGEEIKNENKALGKTH